MKKDSDYKKVIYGLEHHVGWDKEVIDSFSRTEKTLIDSVIKVTKYKIGLVDISKKAYLVWVKPYRKTIVLADSVSDVIEKLNKQGILEHEYKIIDSVGYEIIY